MIGRAGRRGGCQWRAERRGEWWPRNRRPGEVDRGCTNEGRPDSKSAGLRAWFMGRGGRVVCAYAAGQRGNMHCSLPILRWLGLNLLLPTSDGSEVWARRVPMLQVRPQTLRGRVLSSRGPEQPAVAWRPRALGSDLCPHRGAEKAGHEIGACPITGRRLTPAKCSMVVVVAEWLDGAGTMHGTKAALVQLSLREARTQLLPTNRRGKERPRRSGGAAPLC